MARKIVSRPAVGKWQLSAGIHRASRLFGGLLLVCIVFLIPDAALKAESLASKNKEGNRLFAQGKYEDAEKAYLDAQVNSPGRPEVLYNLGNSLIKQKKYDKGIQALRQSISKGDKGIRENSWFNTGNALFSKGSFKDSSEAFIQALRLNPADKDAKHNLEMALLKLRQQEQKQSNSSQKQQNSENPDQNRSQKENRNQASSKDQGSSSGQKGQNEPVKPQKPILREGSISKEQAIQILEAFRNQELEEQRKLMERHARQKTSEKDW